MQRHKENEISSKYITYSIFGFTFEKCFDTFEKVDTSYLLHIVHSIKSSLRVLALHEDRIEMIQFEHAAFVSRLPYNS